MWIRKGSDFHVHLRQGPELAAYAKRSAEDFGQILVMPNTIPPISSPGDWTSYKATISEAVPQTALIGTIKLAPGAETHVPDWKSAGILAGKLYPQGATTNSEDGIQSLEELFPTFYEMEKLGIILSIHGEDPNGFSLDREWDFIPQVESIIKTFPELKVVVEHISDARTISWIQDQPLTVAATITAHHLWLSMDDYIGGAMDPHHFCKPVIKSPNDRDALVSAAVNSEGRFFFGSDSAPHSIANKNRGAAGIYSAPTAIPILAQIFDERNRLDKLEPFLTTFGETFYEVPAGSGKIRIEKEKWTIPERIDEVVPLGHGRNLSWRVVDRQL